MPRYLFISFIAAAFFFFLHAILAPFYETGFSIYLSPFLFIALSFSYISFIRRKKWSWAIAIHTSCWVVIINIIFPPMPENFGELTSLARLIVSIEVVSCFFIFLGMLNKKTKLWFYGESA